ncbi:hypothetical protein D4764_20G0000270 [Takifugu flavidus]|uniref:Uncharacterized protein n=1 Tax=Takifugu flavidus TaxID=433684 RepID=A0A5C6NG71_9TELE|nr:hypothetical protein D4764_20G0000270 [Takifugu flavidus]
MFVTSVKTFFFFSFLSLNTGLQDWVLRPLNTGQVRPVGGSVSLPKVTDRNQANAPGPATAGTRHPPAARPRHLLSGAPRIPRSEIGIAGSFGFRGLSRKPLLGQKTRQNLEGLEGLEQSEVRGCDRRRQCALIIFTLTMCADCEQADGGRRQMDVYFITLERFRRVETDDRILLGPACAAGAAGTNQP